MATKSTEDAVVLSEEQRLLQRLRKMEQLLKIYLDNNPTLSSNSAYRKLQVKLNTVCTLMEHKALIDPTAIEKEKRSISNLYDLSLCFLSGTPYNGQKFSSPPLTLDKNNHPQFITIAESDQNEEQKKSALEELLNNRVNLDLTNRIPQTSKTPKKAEHSNGFFYKVSIYCYRAALFGEQGWGVSAIILLSVLSLAVVTLLAFISVISSGAFLPLAISTVSIIILPFVADLARAAGRGLDQLASGVANFFSEALSTLKGSKKSYDDKNIEKALNEISEAKTEDHVSEQSEKLTHLHSEAESLQENVPEAEVLSQPPIVYDLKALEHPDSDFESDIPDLQVQQTYQDDDTDSEEEQEQENPRV